MNKFIRNDLRGELLTHLPVRPHNQIVAEYDDQFLRGTQILVSTKKGFLLIANGKVRQLLDGQFFGISLHDDRWYVFQRMSYRSGRIFAFRLCENGMADAKQVISGLSPGCHQIDFVGSCLFIMDTYNNRVLAYEKTDQRWRMTAEHYPAGKLSEGRKSSNYAHMNSIWCCDGQTWLMFHNETYKTRCHSEIVRLNEQHEIAEKIRTDASNAHNVIRVDGNFLYCDSLNGSLMHGDSVVYKSEYFTRGLAVTPDVVLVGESQYGARELRDELGGGIAVLDRQFNFLQFIPTPGMVQDVRVVNQIDFGMSNTASKKLALEKV